MKTIFCDIDGTLLKHFNEGMLGQIKNESIICTNVREAIMHWDKMSYTIILVTGRKESLRSITEKQLEMNGIPYDKLIMGLSNGDRILINDKKKDSTRNTAHAINLVRNQGFHEEQYNFQFTKSNNMNQGVMYNNSSTVTGNKIIKPWGSETLIERNDQYVVKKLFMKKDHKCSVQYHINKKETIYVLSGKLKLYVGDISLKDNLDKLEARIMKPGDSLTIEPFTIHRMEGVEDSEYLETSTNELWDVVRLQDAYNRC